MDFPFFNGRRKRLDQFMVMDLGSRTTKAILVQRKGEGFSLLNFAIQDAPISDKAPSPDLLAEHLKVLVQSLGAKTKSTVFTVGVNDSILRHAELPMVSRGDMRMVVKFNTKNYLQQELADYSFDCHVLPQKASGLAPAAGGKAAEPSKTQKSRALVGGARNQLINDLSAAARISGLVAEQITPSLIG